MLTVLKAAPSQKLIALTEVRQRILGSSSDATQDALFNLLIPEVGDAFAVYLGRSLARQQYLEKLSGDGRRHLLLNSFPIDADQLTITVAGTSVTDWSVFDQDTGIINRPSCWPFPSSDGSLNIEATYFGGYVLTDQIVAWASALDVAVGSFVRPSSPALTPLLPEVTAKTGLAGVSEPTWPTTAGQTVVSGLVTYTMRDARELPPQLVGLAARAIYAKFTERTRAPGLASMAGDGIEESYFATQTGQADLPGDVRAGLDLWRFLP